MQVAKQEHINVEMAIALSKYVHDHCNDVPHDIGLHLAEIVNKFTPEEAIPRDQVREMLEKAITTKCPFKVCPTDDFCDSGECLHLKIEFFMSRANEEVQP